ncbi:small heat shock protein (HSP20) family, partial [Rhizoctonia solani]
MEDTSAVSTSRPATPALVHSPSTARSSFSSRDMQTTHRPTPTRQPSWGKRHASLDSPRDRPSVSGGLASSLPTPAPTLIGPPPPDPPHIHTPPSSPSARPYAYPFLPSCEPRGDARPSVSVDIFPDKYLLSCRMPHFDHSSITVATRRGRLLVITADRWDTIEPAPLSLDPALIPNPPQPAHFERRITFGWDAEMGRIRAGFDGVTLHITIPRRLLPTDSATPSRDRSGVADRHHAYPQPPPHQSAKREVAWPLG